MFEVDLCVKDEGFLGRLRGVAKRLFRSGKRVSEEVKSKGVKSADVYEDDASESLAMALGKNVDREVSREVSREIEKEDLF